MRQIHITPWHILHIFEKNWNDTVLKRLSRITCFGDAVFVFVSPYHLEIDSNYLISRISPFSIADQYINKLWRSFFTVVKIWRHDNKALQLDALLTIINIVEILQVGVFILPKFVKMTFHQVETEWINIYIFNWKTSQLCKNMANGVVLSLWKLFSKMVHNFFNAC